MAQRNVGGLTAKLSPSVYKFMKNQYDTDKTATKIFLSSKKQDYVMRSKFEEIEGRWDAFVKKNGRDPIFIYITTPVTNKSAYHLKVESYLGFAYSTAMGLFNGLANFGYLLYDDDRYPEWVAWERLKKHLGLNCSDVCQCMYKALIDLGYEVMFGHLKCQKGGHIVLLVRGLDMLEHGFPTITVNGKKWVVLDFAKKIDKNSSIAVPGEYWCQSTGYFISFNDSWLMSDDGRT